MKYIPQGRCRENITHDCCFMQKGKAFQDALYNAWQHADGKIDASQKTDEGACQRGKGTPGMVTVHPMRNQCNQRTGYKGA